MRRLAILLCVLMNISLVLVPFRTLHAHVSHDHAVVLHGGHSHDFDHDDDHDHGGGHAHDGHVSQVPDQVLNVHFATVDASISPAAWLPFVAFVCALAFCFSFRPYLTAVLRPPAADVRLISTRRNFLHPPLRGPPSIAI